MKKFFMFLIIAALGPLSVFGQEDFDFNCFTVLVGRSASVDGSILVAHNEDNSGQNFVDLHKVPRISHLPGEMQKFIFNADSISEVPETYGYFWITGSKYNEEQYINEWGVAITSNSSRSNEPHGNGRIEHNLRRLVAERARTSREAVKIAGALIEKYGYAASGRVYSIADPNEAWVFEAVNGKHWIARRVPDDEIVLVPNYYVIDDFNMADTLNYLSAPDIIDYAVAMGWYNPQSGKAFNFRRAYCRKDKFEAIHNISRKWVILNQLSEKQYQFYDEFPFSFKPKQKVSIQEIMRVMQNHYEGTEFEMHPSYNNGCPHYSTTTMRVCSDYNDFSNVIQLRNWLPADIGNIMWIAPRYPCIQPFVPWYYGIIKISPNYEKASYNTALQNYNIKNQDYKTMYPDHACWVFDDFATHIDSCYGKEIKSIQEWKTNFQKDVFAILNQKENEIIDIYKSNPKKAGELLTELTNNLAEKALIETKEKLSAANK